MSLNGALLVGRSALAASQAAIQTAGNNMANAATEGFHRRSVHLSPIRGEYLGSGISIGQGVQLAAIRREVDEALQARMRNALAEENASLIDRRFLSAIETLQNELTGNDISTILSQFFNSFSELSNNPTDNAVRAVVIQQGQNLANRIADLKADYAVLRDEVDRSIGTAVDGVNGILDQIADLNVQIVTTEPGGGESSALRDRRDVLLDELAQSMDITVIDHDSGTVDILVSSVPVLLGGVNRGIEMRTESTTGGVEVSMRVREDGTDLAIGEGTIGGLLRQREQAIDPAADGLDEFASELIFHVNRVHAQGQGLSGFETISGVYGVNDPDANLNAADTGLPFRVENGSFSINVTHRDTGQRTTWQINVNGDAMTMNDLIDLINTGVDVPNVTASLSSDRALTLTADSGYEITFSEDPRGALAALGVNAFFTGRTANSIDVREDLASNPGLLSAGLGHVSGSNGTAQAIVNLQDESLASLGGVSLREYWQNQVNDLAVRSSAAESAAQSSGLVRESLSAQLIAVTGVSLDEESINLLTFQRQFQAAARYISVVDETLQILLSLAT